MKRWMMVALVVALTAALVPVALAGTGGSGGDRSQFMVEGIVQSVVPCDGGHLVTVTPTTGTKDVKDIVNSGETMTVKLPDSVSVIECVPPPGSVLIPLSEVTAGCRVMARGVIDRSGSEVAYVAFSFQLMSYAP